MAEQKEVSELAQLGLAIYQARIYSALIALGHSVVTEISGVSSASKTKAYEALKKLSINGVVDFQPGQTLILQNPPSTKEKRSGQRGIRN